MMTARDDTSTRPRKFNIMALLLAGSALGIAGCAQQRTEGYYDPPAESTVTDAQSQGSGAGYRTVLRAPSQVQIALKPDAYHRGGKKAWLLEQMVQLTPVSFWTRILGLTPLEVMEWSRRSDWKSSLRQGWVRALQYQLDVEWIDAAQTMGRDMGHDALLPALMARLSREERESRWIAQFERDRHKLIDAIEGMSQSLDGAELLSPALSARLTEALHAAVGGKQITGNWHSYRADQALLSCARMLDVTALERFAELWRKPSVLDAQPEPESEPQAESAADAGAASAAAAVTATAAAVAAPASIPLTPQQQARLERSRVRPWDEERMRGHLERIVDLRLGLHQAFVALRGPT